MKEWMKKIMDLMESVEDYAPWIIGINVAGAFIYGLLGGVTRSSDSWVVNAVAAVFKYPPMIAEVVLGVVIIGALLYGLFYDLTSEKYEWMLPKIMIGVFAYCFALIVVEHIGSAVAHNLLLVILVAIGLFAVGSVGVTIIAGGVEVYSGAYMFTSFFAEGASVIMGYVLVVTAIGIITDTVLSFF